MIRILTWVCYWVLSSPTPSRLGLEYYWHDVIKPPRIPGWPNRLSSLASDSLASPGECQSQAWIRGMWCACEHCLPRETNLGCLLNCSADFERRLLSPRRAAGAVPQAVPFLWPCLILAGGMYLEAICGKGWMNCWIILNYEGRSHLFLRIKWSHGAIWVRVEGCGDLNHISLLEGLAPPVLAAYVLDPLTLKGLPPPVSQDHF